MKLSLLASLVAGASAFAPAVYKSGVSGCVHDVEVTVLDAALNIHLFAGFHHRP